MELRTLPLGQRSLACGGRSAQQAPIIIIRSARSKHPAAPLRNPAGARRHLLLVRRLAASARIACAQAESQLQSLRLGVGELIALQCLFRRQSIHEMGRGLRAYCAGAVPTALRTWSPCCGGHAGMTPAPYHPGRATSLHLIAASLPPVRIARVRSPFPPHPPYLPRHPPEHTSTHARPTRGTASWPAGQGACLHCTGTVPRRGSCVGAAPLQRLRLTYALLWRRQPPARGGAAAAARWGGRPATRPAQT